MRIIPVTLLIVTLAIACGRSGTDTKPRQDMTTEIYLPGRDNFWIFILAGQSNMAGRGVVAREDTVTDPRILTIDQHDNWILAKEPLHFYEPALAGLDCGMSFARDLLASDMVGKDISIGLIPCAVGGSSIQQWLGDSTHRGVRLFTNFQEKVDLATRRGTIKGILWHQGEANAKPDLVAHYAQDLDSLITRFRTYVKDEDLPVIIGELGSFAKTQESLTQRKAVNMAIHNFAGSRASVYVISTADLTPKADSIHFDAASQRTMGKRFAKKYLEIRAK